MKSKRKRLIIWMTDDERKVSALIQTGVENAITKTRLAELTGLSPRIVEKIVRGLIVTYGIEIASSCEKPFGYFRIASEAEGKRYRNQLISRIRSLNERLAAVDKNTARKISRTLQRELSL